MVEKEDVHSPLGNISLPAFPCKPRQNSVSTSEQSSHPNFPTPNTHLRPAQTSCTHNNSTTLPYCPPYSLPTMPVTQILLLRHGHRLAWTLDPTTGKYTSSHPFPSRLPADPPLASHGVSQARETGTFLAEEFKTQAREGRLRIYSSLFYRCLETLRPTVEGLRRGLEQDDEFDQSQRKQRLRDLEVRGERGVGEWFGAAWFAQPKPGDARMLKERFFPWLEVGYESQVVPDQNGERIEELHDRIARALQAVVKSVDAEFEALGRGREEITVLVCGHAAQIIASGRALTGRWSGDYDEEDFKCFTCGISRFVRRRKAEANGDAVERRGDHGSGWRTNGGVAGGWDCVQNSECGHLSQGEERGWHFHGDESFDSYGPGMLKTSDGGVQEKVTDSNELSSKL